MSPGPADGFKSTASAFVRSRSGATAVEYAILISMVALMIGGFALLGGSVGNTFNTVADEVTPITDP